jgi:hypothetical protein
MTTININEKYPRGPRTPAKRQQRMRDTLDEIKKSDAEKKKIPMDPKAPVDPVSDETINDLIQKSAGVLQKLRTQVVGRAPTPEEQQFALLLKKTIRQLQLMKKVQSLRVKSSQCLQPDKLVRGEMPYLYYKTMLEELKERPSILTGGKTCVESRDDDTEGGDNDVTSTPPPWFDRLKKAAYAQDPHTPHTFLSALGPQFSALLIAALDNVPQEQERDKPPEDNVPKKEEKMSIRKAEILKKRREVKKEKKRLEKLMDDELGKLESLEDRKLTPSLVLAKEADE